MPAIRSSVDIEAKSATEGPVLVPFMTAGLENIA